MEEGKMQVEVVPQKGRTPTGEEEKLIRKFREAVSSINHTFVPKKFKTRTHELRGVVYHEPLRMDFAMTDTADPNMQAFVGPQMELDESVFTDDKLRGDIVQNVMRNIRDFEAHMDED